MDVIFPTIKYFIKRVGNLKSVTVITRMQNNCFFIKVGQNEEIYMLCIFNEYVVLTLTIFLTKETSYKTKSIVIDDMVKRVISVFFVVSLCPRLPLPFISNLWTYDSWHTSKPGLYSTPPTKPTSNNRPTEPLWWPTLGLRLIH